MCRKHNKNGIAHDIMKMAKYRDEDNETRRRVCVTPNAVRRAAKRRGFRQKPRFLPE